MNIKEKFLELTTETYPHGHELELLNKLPNYLKQDEFGNLFYQIGDNPTTMFTCHLDTASHKKENISHIIHENIITSDGRTILGADDKAGVVVLLYLMEHNVTGLYYFFLGEERGCIGSKQLSNKHHTQPIEGINKVVSFDRRGFDSIITHQLTGRSCSNEFANNLAYQMNEVSKQVLDEPFDYKADPTGIYTDSAQFTKIYSECTNISVGYLNEHTHYESQDINHLENLCEVIKSIDWNNLPTFRNIETSKDYSWDWEEDYYYGRSSYSRSSYSYDEPTTTKNTITILDEEFYGHETKVTYDINTYEILEVKPHVGRIMKEKIKIDRLLTSLEVDFDEIDWDGNILVIKNLSEKSTTLTRAEISDYLSNFNDWIETEIKYKKLVS